MRLTIVMSAVIIFASAADVAAECNNRDLRGWWRYSSIVSVTDNRGVVLFSLAESCRLKINARRRITQAQCEDDVGSGERESFIRRRVKLNNDCSFEMSTDDCDFVGQVASDKQAGSGVAFCGELRVPGDRIIFNLIRE